MVGRRTTEPGARRIRSARVAGFTLTEGVHADGSALPWHTHDGPTLCFVLDGSFTEVSGGASLTCTPATLKVMPAGERHCDRFDRGDVHGLLIEADAGRVEAIRPYSGLLEQRVAFHGGILAALARRVFDELRHTDAAAPLAIEGLLLELLATAARQADLPSIGSPPGWLEQVREMIQDDLAARRSLGDLAEAIGVHPVTLARAFRRTVGCSLGEYVRRLRIERAARQLSETDLAIAAIALAAGFSDQSHFSNTFKRQTGMSPATFRRAARGA